MKLTTFDKIMLTLVWACMITVGAFVAGLIVTSLPTIPEVLR